MADIQHSILGERPSRLPVGGKIRAGIQILTQKAAANKQASVIYERGVKAQVPFEEIEKVILGHKNCQGVKNPLRPFNPAYFTVLRRDFAIPENADIIMERYGEERKGDEYTEGRHLYRFPVVFASDVILQNMPHALQCWSSGGIKYWSSYDEDGERYCKMYAPAEKAEGANRVKRRFGGRPVVHRTDLNQAGHCVPDDCPEYQSEACTLTGRLLFFIPGVQSAAAIELRSNSFYGMSSWMDTMRMVAELRRGLLSGTVNGEPIFWMAKVRDEVPRLDPETGQSKLVKQWIPKLEVPIDMTKLAGAAEQRALPPAEAAARIEGPKDTDAQAAYDSVSTAGGQTVSDDDFDDDIPF